MDTSNAAEVLFREFPEWRAFAREETADDGAPFLVVEVPAPSAANVEYGLVIDTSNNEVTVGFDGYHSHFDDCVGGGEHFGMDAAVEFIKQIVSERVSVLSWWAGDAWRGSAQLKAGAAPAIPPWTTASDIDRVRVRSWNGSLNYDGSA